MTHSRGPVVLVPASFFQPPPSNSPERDHRTFGARRGRKRRSGQGVVLCQADNGGCPNGGLYGGTSLAAPAWAAFTALLNQSQGTNLGFLNPLIYPLAGTNAFHGPASMGSDFAHVGLGSPNLPVLHQELTGQTPGPVDPSVSLGYRLHGQHFTFADGAAWHTEPSLLTEARILYVNVNLSIPTAT